MGYESLDVASIAAKFGDTETCMGLDGPVGDMEDGAKLGDVVAGTNGRKFGETGVVDAGREGRKFGDVAKESARFAVDVAKRA